MKNIYLLTVSFFLFSFSQNALTQTELANSSIEFSGTQGQDGWQYGMHAAFDFANFSQLSNFTGFVWNNPGTTLDFPQLDANGGHPDLDNLLWAVRRWTSDHTGNVTISGDFFDRDNGCGDGAHVRIFQNGVEVFQFLDIPTASTPYSLNLDVNNGDLIDFAIDPKFNAGCDDTHFSAVITGSPFNFPFAGFVLPGGKQITIAYDVTVSNTACSDGTIPTNTTLSNQATVTGDNFADVLTDDPDNPAASPAPTLTEIATLTLGNLVYKDMDCDGSFGVGDVGINDVLVYLYIDDGNTVGSLDDMDTFLDMETTAGGGLYTFTGLCDGDYIVVIDPSNFLQDTDLGMAGDQNGALYNMTQMLPLESNPSGAAPDPDNDVDDDDNGQDATFMGNPTIASQAITLATGMETTTNQDGDGNTDTNLTLDFGFRDPISVEVAVVPMSVLENAGTDLVFTFTRSCAVSVATTVNFSVGGTATFNMDYTQSGAATFTATSGTIMIAANMTEATLTVTPTNEMLVEADETIGLTITSSSNYIIGTNNTATGTIENDDNATITLSGGIAQNEGNTGDMTTYTFTATLDNPVDGGFSIAYTTNDGTAEDENGDGDYTDNDGTLAFNGTANEMETIEVVVSGDVVFEADETFTVALGAISNTTLGASISTAGSPQTGTILNDDDPAPALPNTCYGSTGNDDGGQLYTIGGATGTANLINNIIEVGTGTDISPVPGIAINSNGQMYATTFVGPGMTALIRVDALNARAEIIGSITGFGTVHGIAFDLNDVLWGINFDGDVFTINTATGAGTLVGTNAGPPDFAGLAVDPTDGTIYASTASDGGFIHTINPANGAATLIGQVASGRPVADIHFDNCGNLFGSLSLGSEAGDAPFDIFAIDKTTGAGTLLSNTNVTSLAGLAQWNDGAAKTLSIVADTEVQIEGDAGNTTFTFTVTRCNDLAGMTTVDYDVSGFGPYGADAADFGGIFPSGTITFADGEDTQTISIDATGDTDFESSNIFQVTLSNASDAVFAVDNAFSIIRNDDDTAPASIGVCYGSTGNAGNPSLMNGGRLLEIDPATAFTTELVNITLVEDGSNIQPVPGIAIREDGQLFGTVVEVNTGASHLFRINPLTGEAAWVGEIGFIAVHGLEFASNGNLIGASAIGEILNIDPITGAATVLNSTNNGLTGFALDPTNGFLYACSAGGEIGDGNLFVVNPNSGTLSLVGSIVDGPVTDLHFDNNGNLFASVPQGFSQGDQNFDLFAVNKFTGAGTLVGDMGFSSVAGMASLPCPNYTRIYVNDDASGNNNGLDWDNAFNDLQTAIETACTCNVEEIWVAGGTYVPSKDRLGNSNPANNANKTFYMPKNLQLYGGFEGNETMLSERMNIDQHPSILSGDIDNNDANGDDLIMNTADIVGNNSYHVVHIATDVSSGIINGFTIVAGAATGTAQNDHRGGGMFIEGDVTLQFLTIMANLANGPNVQEGEGGGVYIESGAVGDFQDCSFFNNVADNYGGAACETIATTGIYTRCIFQNNQAYSGGAIGALAAPLILKCQFLGNSAEHEGGAIYMANSPFATILNTIFSGNSAIDEGGALYHAASGPTYTNCTFSNNTADVGGVVCNGAVETNTSPTFRNCIFWLNSATTSNPQIAYDLATPGTTTLDYCLLQTDICSDARINCTGVNIIGEDPVFVDADGIDNIVGTLDDDLHLDGCSPAIDTGTNTSAPADDLDENTRPFMNGTADIGAYEFQGTQTQPMANCQSLTRQLDAVNGTVMVNASEFDNTSTGCGTLVFEIKRTNSQIYTSSLSFNCADVFSDVDIDIQVTDDNMNTSTCSTTITIEDVTPPTLTNCPMNITQGTNMGECEADVTWTHPTVSDNCSFSIAVFFSNGDPAPAFVPQPGEGASNDIAMATLAKGQTVVTYMITDPSGNNATPACSFNITITDNENPDFVACPMNIIQNTDAGECKADVSWTHPGITDNCPDAVLSVAYSNGNPAPASLPTGGTVTAAGAATATFGKGETVVTYTIVDCGNNNAATTCSFTVTVTDDEIPDFTNCPMNRTQSTDIGECEAEVSWTHPGIDDNCPDAVLSVAYSNGNPAPASLPTDGVVAASGAATVAFGKGETVVTYTIVDCGDNNAATTCSFTVIITDDEIPDFTNCPMNRTQSTDAGECEADVSWTHPGIDDNCSDAVLSVAYSNGNPAPASLPTGGTITAAGAAMATFGKGETVVTYTIVDCGNNNAATTCSFTVTVTDDEAPNFTSCPMNVAQGTDMGECEADVSWTHPSITDNCPDAVLSVAYSNGNPVPASLPTGGTVTVAGAAMATFSKGETVVTYTIVDCGNNNATTTCSFTVTISDNESPMINCMNTTITLDQNGTASIQLEDVFDGGTDNCSTQLTPVSVFPNTFDCSNLGENTVALTVTDEDNNATTCMPIVTVEVGDLAGVVFVDGSATGDNDGSSWTDAFVFLQDAFNATAGCGNVPISEIRVAEGTYFPDDGLLVTEGNRDEAFVIPSGIKVIGGYPVGGSTFSNPELYESILSGDIDHNDGAALLADNYNEIVGNNSYTVVQIQADATASTLLDGLTITGGKADLIAGTDFQRHGGGLYNQGSPTLLRLHIIGNLAVRGGGGVYHDGTLTQINPRMTNCIIESNFANLGGGIYSASYEANSCFPEFYNCLFYNNEAEAQGGGLAVQVNGEGVCETTITNCTFVANAAALGGGVQALSESAVGELSINNSIFWSNTGGSISQENTDVFINHTLLEEANCPPDVGIMCDAATITLLGEDPLFEDFAMEDFRLSMGSPAINAGDQNLLPMDMDDLDNDGDVNEFLAADLQNDARIQDGEVDLGIFESGGVGLAFDLLTFEATITEEGTAQLKWRVLENAAISHYDIQHTDRNGNVFKTIGKMESDGLAGQLKTYHFEHLQPSIGQNYYRLQQVENSGKIALSDIRLVWLNGSNPILVYPNPVDNTLNVALPQMDSNPSIYWKITDVVGKIVFENHLDRLEEGQQFSISEVELLSAGTYFIEVMAEGKRLGVVEFVKVE